MRDYELWHQAYDDPQSSLSWRLRVVGGFIEAALAQRVGPIRVLSACSGDGRDLLGVLAKRSDAARVSAVLVELHPEIADRARRTAADLASDIVVRTADAGVSDSYAGAVPAELVMMVGIFGNIDAADIARTIAALPQFCAPGATVVWSRGISAGEDNNRVRALFAAAGFTELDYRVFDEAGGGPAVGQVRYDGSPATLKLGQRLFTFRR